MAGSVNKVILIGNLGRDPEVRTTQNGSKVVNLRLATSESWTDRSSGERQERTEWHSIAIFNERLADVAERFLRKGRKVYIEGSLQTRKWTDKDGQERYTTEVVLRRFGGELVLLDRGEGGGAEAGEGNGGGRSYGRDRDRERGGPGGGPGGSREPSWDRGGQGGKKALDDDIPF